MFSMVAHYLAQGCFIKDIILFIVSFFLACTTLFFVHTALYYITLICVLIYIHNTSLFCVRVCIQHTTLICLRTITNLTTQFCVRIPSNISHYSVGVYLRKCQPRYSCFLENMLSDVLYRKLRDLETSIVTHFKHD